MVNDLAKAAAAELLQEAGRRVDIPVRRSFVRAESADTLSPMVSLLRGGRGGAVPIRLYIALIWRAARRPYESAESSHAWATLLGLEDPGGRGSRRIREALRRLEAANLIRIEHRPGKHSVITLLQEDGSGADYEIPSAAFRDATQGQRDAHRYFKVPVTLWTEGIFQDLTSPALAMLMILLSERASETGGVWFSMSAFQERYGIAPATRASGTKELRERELLYEGRMVVGENPHQSNRAFASNLQRRKVYYLLGYARIQPLKQPPSA